MIDANPKAVLRREALARRRGLPPEVRARFAERLALEGLRLANLWRPRVISVFYPLPEEPDTLALFAALAAAGFPTALPVVVGRARALDLPSLAAG